MAKPSTKQPFHSYDDDEYRTHKKQRSYQRKNKRKLKEALRQQDWEAVSSISDDDRKN